jgi:hypothetical protein
MIIEKAESKYRREELGCDDIEVVELIFVYKTTVEIFSTF